MHSGREYCLDEYLREALEDPLPLGDSRQVLVELLPHSTAESMRGAGIYDRYGSDFHTMEQAKIVLQANLDGG